MGSQQIIRDKLEKLKIIIKTAKWENCDTAHMSRLAEERINELQQNGVECVENFIQKLIKTKGKEEYLDILMEGRFAITLARNNLSNIEIEYCNKGPDLKAMWNKKTLYFEVTRKRPSEDDDQHSYPRNEPYWVERSKIEAVIGKIQSKLRQLECGETNIIVLWSDTPSWTQNVIGEAYKYITQEISEDPNKYKDLSAVLFTTGGVNMVTLKQFYVFENNKASKPLGSRLFKKLEALHERDLNQLKREKKELEAAMTRLVGNEGNVNRFNI